MKKQSKDILNIYHQPRQHSILSYSQFLGNITSVIRVCRILCIFMMTYVHINLFEDDSLSSTPYFILTKNVLANLLGRSCVPLLSVISGLLMVSYFAKYSARRAIKLRFTTILIPFFTWCTVGYLVAIFTGDVVFNSGVGIALEIITSPYNTHLNFLRDIFIVSIFTPLFVLLLKRLNVLLLLIIILLVSVVEFGSFLREQILIYFVFGVYIGVYRTENLFSSNLMVYTVVFSFCAMLLLTLLQPLYPVDLEFMSSAYFDNLVRRPLCALTFWYFAFYIAEIEKVNRFLVKHIEPAIFLLFLSHVIISLVLGSLYSRIDVLHTPFLYFIVWFSIPIVTLVLSVLGNRYLCLLPSFVSVLFVGRVNKNVKLN